MESRSKNINSFWGYLLIDEFVRNGIICFCISPGSRSTPLTIAVAENNQAEKIVCLDERAAAFHALGYARACRKPAVIISTSGTAAANYYPAITEAKNLQIPLIIVTADRPPELRDTGANQTIDQVKMFGNFLKWQFDLPCPDTQISARFPLTTVDQAVHRATNAPAGPVHLNCMFREPLEPSENEFPGTYIKSISNWEQSRKPFTEYTHTITTIDDADVQNIANIINNTKNGLLVVGQLNGEAERNAVKDFTTKLRWPVFADITSGVRNKTELIGNVPYFDQMLLSDKTMEVLNPEIIIHFGRLLTSKRYLNTVKEKTVSKYIQFEESDTRLDPAHVVTQRICGDIAQICKTLLTRIDSKTDQVIEQYLKDMTDRIDNIIESYCSPDQVVTEISTARLIVQNLSSHQGLFLASSMPIRDFDMYAGSHLKTNDVSSNRGVSGIDGTLASAVGYSRGLKKGVTVVIGDLAMIHDLNSLSLVHKSKYPITIVLINNGGGGIFSFLPVSRFEHVFDQYFATTHQYNFAQVSQMFDIDCKNPSSNGEFVKLYKQSIKSDKSTLIEINTLREENLSLHQEIQKKIITALEK
jgi:2-succinyl-5-enolpyruvyl-6-hydroxy-3-cyclohexene-1-carboxylate synthase